MILSMKVKKCLRRFGKTRQEQDARITARLEELGQTMRTDPRLNDQEIKYDPKVVEELFIVKVPLDAKITFSVFDYIIRKNPNYVPGQNLETILTISGKIIISGKRTSRIVDLRMNHLRRLFDVDDRKPLIESYLHKIRQLLVLKTFIIEEFRQTIADRKNEVLKKLTSLNPSKITQENAFYEALGWLAKNLTSIRASIPDFTEDWFIRTYGDVERVVVDTGLENRTIGNYVKKWLPSFTLSIKAQASRSNLPPLVKLLTSTLPSRINNTDFISELVQNYGFSFGKKQDINKILSTLTLDQQKDFKVGYTMEVVVQC